MRRDVVLCGATAVAIHALVFSAPVLKGNNVARSPSYEPIRVSVFYPEKQLDKEPVKELQSKAPPVSRRPSAAVAKAEPRKELVPVEHIKPQKTASIEIDIDEPAEVIISDTEAKISDSPSVEPPGQTISHVAVKRQTSMATPQEFGATKDRIIYATPKYKENPPPHYPRIARRRGYEGKTMLRVLVLASGKPGQVEIEESSGFSVLDNAALNSVRKWMFIPGEVDGRKTKQWINVPIRFELK